MKKPFIVISLLLALLFAVATPASTHANVLAQDPNKCYDATGAEIPCPPTPGGGDEEEDEDNSTGGGNQNPPSSVNTPIPTASFTPEPTATPLPFALPEGDYLGSCNSASGNLQDCLDQFACEDGTLVIEVDIYTGGNGTQYDVYCIPHEEFPKLDLPIALPPDDGSTNDTNWGGYCHGDGDVDQCIDDLASLCDGDGGDLSVWYDDDGGAGAYCENSTPADTSPAPTEVPAIAAAPNDDGTADGSSWDEECGYWTCWLSSLSCLADGGTGYELDHASGAHIYHCDIPASKSGASFPMGPTAFVILIIVGVVAVPIFMRLKQRAKPSAQTREHILLNKDDGNTSGNTGGGTGGTSGGSGGSKPKPKPNPQPSPSPRPSTGDFNGDGDVTPSDFLGGTTGNSNSSRDVVVTREDKDRR